MAKPNKPPMKRQTDKKINYCVIGRSDVDETAEAAYNMLTELIQDHHPDLIDARIAMSWRYGWTEDADGRLKLGQCKKASDLDRQLHAYDFVILLNYEMWTNPNFTDAQRRAVLDHELCHCDVAKDADGDTRFDEHGELVYRTRRHDIEEFEAVVRRHGIYTENVERFAAALAERAKQPLLSE